MRRSRSLLLCLVVSILSIFSGNEEHPPNARSKKGSILVTGRIHIIGSRVILALTNGKTRFGIDADSHWCHQHRLLKCMGLVIGPSSSPFLTIRVEQGRGRCHEDSFDHVLMSKASDICGTIPQY
ncbi:uncharacterized protein F4807DRAFT_1316 [Annulohypoxylon truncatum]|uniref:uncharacterized protein n=1 Tax=Annulohypoxylon truncatum TaxID=327061 RepID=UPI00200795EE|nr:uncharacterized protein F4807DRAFT_1316 [Annulohypoxylon truncatum]KAI1214542.1 hypothetical protein F4807DRAFT_1316 [Annulohypoxylon truncatum]